MKNDFLFLCFLIFSLQINVNVDAQKIKVGKITIDMEGKGDEIVNVGTRELKDSSSMQCMYEHFVIDTVLNQRRIYLNILNIGLKLSKYEDYFYYKIDSLLNAVELSKLTVRGYYELQNQYQCDHGNYGITTYMIFKNNNPKDIDCYYKLMIDWYIYKETADLFEWTITDDTATVCGYPCYKAVTDFRGRKWEAYFTMEIPINDGPWKFCGLPGLILKVQSEDNQHIFNAVSVRKVHEPIIIKVRDYFKTERKRINEQLKNYYLNPAQMLTTSGLLLDKDGKPTTDRHARRGFFNPIELE